MEHDQKIQPEIDRIRSGPQHFDIGDKVYVSAFLRKPITIPCPDCLGSKRIRVILGDNTEISIECGGCDPGGYEPPRGYITNYEWTGSVDYRVIIGVEKK